MSRDDNKGFENLYKGIAFLCIVITLVFLLFISFYAARNDQGNHCTTKKYMNTSGKQLQNSVQTLTDTETSILQPYKLTDKGLYGYKFCFGIASNTTDAFRVRIVDHNNTVLGTEFVQNDTTRYCTPLNDDLLQDEGYIGIKCDNCKTNEKLCVKEEILGTTVKRVRNNGTVEVEYDNTLDYTLYANQDCNETITFFMKWYITILSLIAVGVLIFFGGYEKIKKLLIDDSPLK